MKQAIYSFLGRKGDVVSIGGLTISCSKVENALLSLPYVSDAIVLSVADRKRDETMAAFLVLKEEKNQSAIRMDLKTRLMIQEMPRHLIICSELPLTAAGKVDRRALLKMLETKEVRSSDRKTRCFTSPHPNEPFWLIWDFFVGKVPSIGIFTYFCPFFLFLSQFFSQPLFEITP